MEFGGRYMIYASHTADKTNIKLKKVTPGLVYISIPRRLSREMED